VSDRGRIPELDGIRGIAIGMVFFYHLYSGTVVAPMRSTLAYAMTLSRLTWSGVDLFFVLSGFLIGGILLDNRDATNYFKTFYVRRFLRIVPLYFICLAVLYLLMHEVQKGASPRFSFLLTKNEFLPWTPHFFFIQNFWMAVRNHNGFLGITWSLAVEEQFYLTLPFLIRVLSRKSLAKTTCAVIIGAPVLRTILFFAWPGHSWAGMALLPCRADSLMLGVLGAIIVRNPLWNERLRQNRRALQIALVAFAASLPLLIKFAHSQHGFGMQTFGFTWLAAAYLCFVLYTTTFGESILAGIVRPRPLRWLGTVAYGAYLYHGFVMWAIFGIFYSTGPKIESAAELGVSFLVIAATLILCQLSWSYFEKPLIRLGHKVPYRFRPAATPALARATLPDAASGISL
jgi:peptidoglycan/LPS O-acetylase OafA/YrhL